MIPYTNISFGYLRNGAPVPAIGLTGRLGYCYLYFSTIFTIRSKSSPTLFSGSNCSRHLNDPTPLL